ncbi:hypothetical protein ISS312_02041 [Alteromonas mediterranea]|nr:hypothetical protein ISS312_02041 [Alteromonas mediterranea]
MYFVTNGTQGDDFPGRMVIYCAQCRKERPGNLDISLPIALLTTDLFKGLYIMGKTETDPQMAIQMAFGQAMLILKKELEGVLELKKSSLKKFRFISFWFYKFSLKL